MEDFRRPVHRFLSNVVAAPDAQLRELLENHLTPDAVWDIAYPIDRLEGIDAVLEGLIVPLRRALAHVRRRDEIFIGGHNRRKQGGTWVASVSHYVGTFSSDLVGIAPNHRLVFLRSGEFYRLENGRIAEAKIILDFLDLLRQIDRFPLPRLLGTEMLFPGPATHDGVLPVGGGRGGASLDLVESMLGDLRDYDAETLRSKGQVGEDGYWHEDMLWYGPGGIGSNYRWEGFVKDHRAPFLVAFPDRVGGNHYCRIGDGDYASVGGWPSMTMTHAGDYLGVEATGRPLTLRVMDFYRCADGQIRENWVLLDYVELFQQMGVDLLARARALE